MRIVKSVGSVAVVFCLAFAVPAQAVGLGDLAKVVLGGNSVLKKAQKKCGSSFSLTSSDELALGFARAAAEKALPLSEFRALDAAAESDASSQSQSATFCPETAKKKSGLLSKIKKAGKSLAKAKMFS